jgi:hypothetical protein
MLIAAVVVVVVVMVPAGVAARARRVVLGEHVVVAFRHCRDARVYAQLLVTVLN